MVWNKRYYYLSLAMIDPEFSDSEIRDYRERGYIVVPELIPPETIVGIDRAIQDLTARALSQDDYSDVLELEPGSPDDQPAVRRIYQPFVQHQSFERLARDPGILDRVEQLIGPDIHLQHSKLNMKPAEVGSVVEWHQDLTYFPHTNDDLVAVLVYLDEATEINGCLRVLSGQHAAFLEHNTDDGAFAGMITEDLSGGRYGTEIALPAPAGSVIFMHCLTPHSSRPNQSRKPRRTIIFEYRAADSFPLYLGEMSARNEEFAIQIRGNPATHARLGDIAPPIPRFAGKVSSLYDLQEKTQSSRA